MWELSSLESADCASSRCNNESAGLVVNRHQPVERLIPVLCLDFNKTIGFGYAANQKLLYKSKKIGFRKNLNIEFNYTHLHKK